MALALCASDLRCAALRALYRPRFIYTPSATRHVGFKGFSIRSSPVNSSAERQVCEAAFFFLRVREDLVAYETNHDKMRVRRTNRSLITWAID